MREESPRLLFKDQELIIQIRITMNNKRTKRSSDKVIIGAPCRIAAPPVHRDICIVTNDSKDELEKQKNKKTKKSKSK